MNENVQLVCFKFLIAAVAGAVVAALPCVAGHANC